MDEHEFYELGDAAGEGGSGESEEEYVETSMDEEEEEEEAVEEGEEVGAYTHLQSMMSDMREHRNAMELNTIDEEEHEHVSPRRHPYATRRTMLFNNTEEEEKDGGHDSE